ncbi:MAG: response regulator [Candidatus Omnitrophota bacterium]|jgi:YesN/AraC family two-component response regulator
MSKNILVIDDEELVTESLKRLFKKEGYTVAIARNNTEAMEKIKEIEFNLVVSDIRMPEVNGLEIIKNIRHYYKISQKKPIPEILITGYSSDEHLKEAQALKVADYLSKPFDIKDFLEIVKKNLK